MSIEAVNQFLTKVREDQELQAEVTTAMEAENDRQAVTELAAKHGYEFTPDELGSQVEQALEASNAGDLNEAELEAVAGGLCTPAIGIGIGIASGAAGVAAEGVRNAHGGKKGW